MTAYRSHANVRVLPIFLSRLFKLKWPIVTCKNSCHSNDQLEKEREDEQVHLQQSTESPQNYSVNHMYSQPDQKSTNLLKTTGLSLIPQTPQIHAVRNKAILRLTTGTTWTIGVYCNIYCIPYFQEYILHKSRKVATIEGVPCKLIKGVGWSKSADSWKYAREVWVHPPLGKFWEFSVWDCI